MKKMLSILVILALLVGLSTCNTQHYGYGPVHVEVSYPGPAYLNVGIQRPNLSHLLEDRRFDATVTYQEDFFDGEKMIYFGLNCHKYPDAPYDPTGALYVDPMTVVITAEFGTFVLTAPAGQRAVELRHPF